MGWPNNFVQGVYNALGSLIGVYDGAGGQIGLTPTYTWATKPLASAYTGRAFISDIGGGSVWISNGTRWYPENGRVVLYNLPAAVSGTYLTVGITAQYLLPGGVWQDGDILEITNTASKTGTTTVGSHAIRIGSAGLVSDTAINSGTTSQPGVLNLSVNTPNNRIKRLGATTCKFMGIFWNSVGSSTSGISTDSTVDNLDLPVYITRTSLASAPTGDTFTLHEFTITLVAMP